MVYHVGNLAGEAFLTRSVVAKDWKERCTAVDRVCPCVCLVHIILLHVCCKLGARQLFQRKNRGGWAQGPTGTYVTFREMALPFFFLLVFGFVAFLTALTTVFSVNFFSCVCVFFFFNTVECNVAIAPTCRRKKRRRTMLSRSQRPCSSRTTPPSALRTTSSSTPTSSISPSRFVCLCVCGCVCSLCFYFPI